MDSIWNIFGIVMSLFQGDQLSQKQNQYNSLVDSQIKQGKDLYQARLDTAMQMFRTDPDFAAARTRLQGAERGAFDEVQSVSRTAVQNRHDFENTYDTRTGQYLAQNDQSTAGLLSDLQQKSGAITGQFGQREADVMKSLGDVSTGYGQRESDVMGLLAGQGDQALADTQRTFGEQTGSAMGDLTSRGLSGSGVGASVRGGLARQESDQLARIREQVAAQKAGALTGLRGDTLDFGERQAGVLAGLRGDTIGFGEQAMGLGAQFRESGINRQLNAAANAQGLRASHDAAFRGSAADQRSRALDRAYGMNTDYTNYLNTQGTNRVNSYMGLTGEQAGYVGGGPIQYVPPDVTGYYNSISQMGRGIGYSF